MQVLGSEVQPFIVMRADQDRRVPIKSEVLFVWSRLRLDPDTLARSPVKPPQETLLRLGVDNIDTTNGMWFSDYGLAVQAATSNQGMLLACLPVTQATFDTGLLVCPFPDSVLTTDIGFDVVTTYSDAEKPEVATFVKWLIEIEGQENIKTN